LELLRLTPTRTTLTDRRSARMDTTRITHMPARRMASMVRSGLWAECLSVLVRGTTGDGVMADTTVGPAITDTATMAAVSLVDEATTEVTRAEAMDAATPVIMHEEDTPAATLAADSMAAAVAASTVAADTAADIANGQFVKDQNGWQPALPAVFLFFIFSCRFFLVVPPSDC